MTECKSLLYWKPYSCEYIKFSKSVMSALYNIPYCIYQSHWIVWVFIACFELHHIFKIYSYSKSQFVLKYIWKWQNEIFIFWNLL